jgi:hypothetical protein
LCVGWDPGMASGAGRLLLLPGLVKISSYIMTSARTSLEAPWKNRGLVSKDIRMLFLSPFTYVHVKKGGGESYFLAFPHIRDVIFSCLHVLYNIFYIFPSFTSFLQC